MLRDNWGDGGRIVWLAEKNNLEISCLLVRPGAPRQFTHCTTPVSLITIGLKQNRPAGRLTRYRVDRVVKCVCSDRE
jgi:hypothetical protein